MHDFTIPFGPQHPSIKEPTCLRLSLDGNRIVEAKIRLGYAHKGIEKLLEGKRIEQAIHITQRVCGICNFCHQNCFNLVIEKMLNYDAPRRVKYIRTLMAELERLQSHSLWAGFMMHEFGFDSLFQYFMRDREHIIEIFERITGGRIHHAVNMPKTVTTDLTESDAKFILEKMNILEQQFSKYLEMVKADSVLKARLVGVGKIKKTKAERYNLVGPIARASGIRDDIRKRDGYDAYSEIDFDVITGRGGDAHARFVVRIKEMLESIKIIRQVLKNLPKEEIPKVSLVFIEKATEIGRVEAPRGENFYFVEVEHNKISRVRIRTPTFANMDILPRLLRHRVIGDTQVILHSLDPCFACLERVIIVKDGKTEVLNEDGFRSKYT